MFVFVLFSKPFSGLSGNFHFSSNECVYVPAIWLKPFHCVINFILPCKNIGIWNYTYFYNRLTLSINIKITIYLLCMRIYAWLCWRHDTYMKVNGAKICLISVTYQKHWLPSFKGMGILAETPVGRLAVLGTKRRSLGPESCLPERDRTCAHPAWPIM